MEHKRAAMRKLLDEAFDDEALRVFCFDFFKEVQGQFAAGESKMDRILRLITHAEQHNQVDNLLAFIQQARPEKYGQYESTLSISIQAAPRPIPLNLPLVARRSFFGRDAQRDQIVVAVRNGDLTLIHGMGGIGKTSLAVAVVKELTADPEFAGAILWVDASDVESLDALSDTIARQAGDERIPLLTGTAKAMATKALLASAVRLVVLDDASTLTVRLFLRQCLPDGTALLVTDRERYLATDMNEDLPVRSLERAAAVALFRDRMDAGEAGSSDEIDAICAVLGDHPLAVVVAAGQVRRTGIPLDRLRKRLQEATGRVRLEVGEGKEYSVLASLSLSFTQMQHEGESDRELRVIEGLAACFGATTGIGLLAGICASTESECEAVIGRLVERSLVERAEERVGLHPLVRDYVRVHLGDAGLREAKNRVLNVVVGYTERYREHGEEFGRLVRELNNIVGAQAYAFQQGRWGEVLIIALGVLAKAHLYISGYWREWVEVGKRGIEAASQLGDEEARAHLLQNTAIGMQSLGDVIDAQRMVEESLAIRRRLGSLSAIAESLGQLGILTQERGEFDKARELYEESLDIFQQIENHSGIAHSQYQLGILAHNQGQYDEARRLYTQSSAISRQMGDQSGIADCLGQLGRIGSDQGDYDEARRLYMESLAIKRQQRDQAKIAVLLHNLGIVDQNQGKYEEAQQLLEESLAIRRLLGDQSGIANSLHQLAVLAQDLGEFGEARRSYTESLAINRQLGNQQGIANSLAQLGILAHKRREYDAAQQMYDEVLEIRERLGDQMGIATSLHNQGLLAQHRSEYDEAQRLYTESLAIKRQLGSQAGIASSLYNLGILAQIRGDQNEAKGLYGESLSIFERLDSPDAEIVRSSLSSLAEQQATSPGADDGDTTPDPGA